mgnify:FL=1
MNRATHETEGSASVPVLYMALELSNRSWRPAFSDGAKCCPAARSRVSPVEPGYRNLYHRGMKTTLDINDRLLAEAKVLAARNRTSLTRLIEEGLQLRLRSAASPVKAGKLKIPFIKGRGGLVAGVNPLSNKALLGALDDDA